MDTWLLWEDLIDGELVHSVIAMLASLVAAELVLHYIAACSFSSNQLASITKR